MRSSWGLYMLSAHHCVFLTVCISNCASFCPRLPLASQPIDGRGRAKDPRANERANVKDKVGGTKTKAAPREATNCVSHRSDGAKFPRGWIRVGILLTAGVCWGGADFPPLQKVGYTNRGKLKSQAGKFTCAVQPVTLTVHSTRSL